MREDIIEVIDRLKQLIDKYNINRVQAQIDCLNNLKEKLLSETELNTRQKLTVYNQLFPPRGGFSDINYWHDNFELRKKVNEQINILITKIANYLLHE